MKYLKKFESIAPEKRELLVGIDEVKDYFYDLIDDGFQLIFSPFSNPYILHDENGDEDLRLPYPKEGTMHKSQCKLFLEGPKLSISQLDWFNNHSKYFQLFNEGIRSLMLIDEIKIEDIKIELQSDKSKFILQFNLYQTPNMDVYPDERLSLFISHLKRYLEKKNFKDLEFKINDNSIDICSDSINYDNTLESLEIFKGVTVLNIDGRVITYIFKTDEGFKKINIYEIGEKGSNRNPLYDSSGSLAP